MSDSTTQTLTQLGDTTPEKVIARFTEVRQRFDSESSDLDKIGVGGLDKWETLRVSWVGRKSGVLSQISDNWLKPAPRELKQAVGQAFNELKSHIESSLEDLRAKQIQQLDVGPPSHISNISAHIQGTSNVRATLTPEDLSLPGVERAIGTRHLIRQTFHELLRIFLSIGFSVVEGPEIETPYYNFEALNIPEHHPARDNMDTFYIEGARGGHLGMESLRQIGSRAESFVSGLLPRVRHHSLSWRCALRSRYTGLLKLSSLGAQPDSASQIQRYGQKI